MRLWTLHPKYLDARGLVALWREALLAQAVLRGQTKGYVHHPQLYRFRDAGSPVGGIAEYLRVIRAEATVRGYSFDGSRIGRARSATRIVVTSGQIALEWEHLGAKVRGRDPRWFDHLSSMRVTNAEQDVEPHPLFDIIPGDVADWERAPHVERGV